MRWVPGQYLLDAMWSNEKRREALPAAERLAPPWPSGGFRTLVNVLVGRKGYALKWASKELT